MFALLLAASLSSLLDEYVNEFTSQLNLPLFTKRSEEIKKQFQEQMKDCNGKWFSTALSLNDFYDAKNEFKEIKKGEYFCIYGPALIAANASFKVESKYLKFNAEGEIKVEDVSIKNPLILTNKISDDEIEMKNPGEIISKVMCDDGDNGCDIQFTYLLQPLKFKSSFKSDDVNYESDVDFKVVVSTESSYSKKFDASYVFGLNLDIKGNLKASLNAKFHSLVLFAAGKSKKKITAKSSNDGITSVILSENGKDASGRVIGFMPIPNLTKLIKFDPQIITDFLTTFKAKLGFNYEGSVDLKMEEDKTASADEKNYYPEGMTFEASGGVKTKDDVDKGSGLGTGAIVGIVIGVLVVVAIIVVIVVVVIMKSKGKGGDSGDGDKK
ncbi:hypothetical protein TVAG_124480 [Trichomonas vaginalis G3]|uniref:Uncharacterized protein n=1 Tax=Trichomonas vaginalis (strain ATCC PRA-98 / G3) TaxID=412133 RepID=A2FYM6_TRIV3|nr:glycoprotein 38 family [Trichomonas vaginalis G3]EAX89977.1 hypothetical protein TVAG_124480 [Trichomonas vaginalis G3]KAI5539118.1 glycoprotein 38 family [Trichomonas vaginalis G3]|eukprot:XP_001302907.1 hypothetical protein [Trichomonas vaginalis G3]